MASPVPKVTAWPRLCQRLQHGLACAKGYSMASPVPKVTAWPRLCQRLQHGLDCAKGYSMASTVPKVTAWPQLCQRLQHGLDCAKGGLVRKVHNDLRDSDARIADVALGGVATKPILVPENDKKGLPLLQVD